MEVSSKILHDTECLFEATQARSVTHHVGNRQMVSRIARQLWYTKMLEPGAYSALSHYHVVIHSNAANGPPLLFGEIQALASHGIAFTYRFAE